MHGDSSSKEYLSAGSSKSMRPDSPARGSGVCADEKDYWRVFVKVCELEREDVKKLYGQEYTSMTKISLLGLKKDEGASLVEKAGMSEVKAQMVYLFATYLLHCKYHRIHIPKHLSFDQVLEFGFLMNNPKEYRSSSPPTTIVPEEILPPLDACSGHSGTSMGSSTLGSSKTSSKGSSKTSSTKSSKKKKRASDPLPQKRITRKQRAPTSKTPQANADVCDQSSVVSKSSLRSGRSLTSKKSVSFNFEDERGANRQIPRSSTSLKSFRKIPSIDEQTTATAATVDTAESMGRSLRESTSFPGVRRMGTNSTQESTSFPGLRRAGTNSTETSTQSRWSNNPGSDTESRVSLSKTGSNSDLLSCPSRRPSIQVGSNSAGKNANFVYTSKDKSHNNNLQSLKEIPNQPIRHPPARVSGGPRQIGSRWPQNVMLAVPNQAPPPSCAAARSSLRWAQALDVEEDLTDTDWSDSDDDSDDDSDWDSSDEEDSDSDDDSSDEDSDEEEEKEEEEPAGRPKKRNNKEKEGVASSSKTTVTWKTHNVTIEEWTMPMNQVMPVNLQDLLKKAAGDPNFDIQKQIHQALQAKGISTPQAA